MNVLRFGSSREPGSSAVVRRSWAGAALSVAALCLLSGCAGLQVGGAAQEETAPIGSAAPTAVPTSAPSSTPSSTEASVPEAKPVQPPAPEPPKAIRDGFAYLNDGVKISVDGDDKAQTDGYSVTIRDAKFRIGTTEFEPNVAKMRAELGKSSKITQVSVVAFDNGNGAIASCVLQTKEPKTAVEMLKKVGDKVFRCTVKVDGTDKDKSFRTSAVKICKSLVAAE